jgi:hypothetical protein
MDLPISWLTLQLHIQLALLDIYELPLYNFKEPLSVAKT